MRSIDDMRDEAEAKEAANIPPLKETDEPDGWQDDLYLWQVRYIERRVCVDDDAEKQGHQPYTREITANVVAPNDVQRVITRVANATLYRTWADVDEGGTWMCDKITVREVQRLNSVDLLPS